MTPEAQDILKKIAYRIWNAVLDGDGVEHPGFHRVMSDTLDVTVNCIIPEKDKKNWLQALNALSSHSVSTYALYENINEVGDYINSDLCCIISDINPKQFIDFCNSFGINLKIRPDTHTARLAISPENEPIICIDNKVKYELPPLHDSTVIRMLKIAFQPSLQGIPLTIDQLNKEGSSKETVSRVLGGKVLKIGASIKRLKKYRYDIKIPKFLDEFYMLTDATIIMFARYAKEDFDSDSLERKQYVLKALGAELKLSGRTIVFSPVKYLIPIEKAVKNLNTDNNLVRTCSQQRKNDPEGSDNSSWCWK